jgi:DNA polymerase III psi subunit
MLDKMGIATWQARGRYLIWINPKEAPEGRAHLSQEKKQLLDRLLQALCWPKEKTVYLLFESADYFSKCINSYRPLSMLLVDIEQASVPESIQYAQLPSLEKLLHDREAKRKAWKDMQFLREEMLAF